MLFRVVYHRLLQRGICEPPRDHLPRQILIMVIRLEDQLRFAPLVEICARGHCVRASVRAPHFDRSDEAMVGRVKAEIRFIPRQDCGHVYPLPFNPVRRYGEDDGKIGLHYETDRFESALRIRVAGIVDSAQNFRRVPAAEGNGDMVVVG